jgi:hypothetical protein
MKAARLLWVVVVGSAIALAASMIENGYQADRDGTGGGPRTTELVLAVVCIAALVAAVVATRRARRALPVTDRRC